MAGMDSLVALGHRGRSVGRYAVAVVACALTLPAAAQAGIGVSSARASTPKRSPPAVPPATASTTNAGKSSGAPLCTSQMLESWALCTASAPPSSKTSSSKLARLP